MGWYQDNFPGSAAQKQRSFIARGAIVYSLVIGSLYYLYWPTFRRYRTELAQGREPADWDFWEQHKREFQTNANLSRFGSPRNRDDLLESQKVFERANRGDLEGPDLTEQRIRERVNRNVKQ